MAVTMHCRRYYFYSGFKPFKVLEAGILFTEGRRLLFGNSKVIIHTLFSSVSRDSLVLKGLFTNYVTWLVSSLVNRDGCHMCGMKLSLFPEHMISLPLESSWIQSFIIYTLLNLSVLGLRINDSGLIAWISLTALSRDLFYCNTSKFVLECLRMFLLGNVFSIYFLTN